MGPALPVPTLDALHLACRSFPMGTALGVDQWHPRALLRISQAGQRAFLRLLVQMELAGCWPSAVRQVNIVELAKDTGGGPSASCPRWCACGCA